MGIYRDFPPGKMSIYWIFPPEIQVCVNTYSFFPSY
jgi:hypothetical protein